MSGPCSIEQSCKLLKDDGYVVFKPAPVHPSLVNKHLYSCHYVPAHTLTDHCRSEVIQVTAHSVLDKGIRPISSKENWRVLEQAFRSVRNLEGEVWETGVYQGVTASLLANCIRQYGPSSTTLRLFDTFEGMPEVNPQKDLHRKGNFSDTSLEAVRDLVGDDVQCSYHKGMIPDTFHGLENAKLKLVHIDLDIYQSIKDTLNFCYPRMGVGIFIFDDYGAPSCPGALEAVDEFFAYRSESIFTFATGQAIMFKWA